MEARERGDLGLASMLRVIEELELMKLIKLIKLMTRSRNWEERIVVINE